MDPLRLAVNVSTTKFESANVWYVQYPSGVKAVHAGHGSCTPTAAERLDDAQGISSSCC